MSAAFACASVVPTSFGTMHAGGGGGGSKCRRVYEIGAEKVTVVLPATSTAKPGEPSSAALPVAAGTPAQSGPR